jgi:hypothetical protein
VVKIPLKHKFSDLFRGKLPIPQKLFECLEDLGNQIDAKKYAEPVFAYDIKLNKTNLKKEFGEAKEFNNIGIVHNKEGSYLIVADKYGHWLYYTLDEV